MWGYPPLGQRGRTLVLVYAGQFVSLTLSTRTSFLLFFMLTPPSPKTRPDLGPEKRGGNSVSGLCAPCDTLPDASRAQTEDRRKKFVQSPIFR